MVRPLRRKSVRGLEVVEMEMMGEVVEEVVSLGSGEVKECDGMVVGGVIDGKVKSFVGEIGEELVEEVDGRDVDSCHSDKNFRVTFII